MSGPRPLFWLLTPYNFPLSDNIKAIEEVFGSLVSSSQRGSPLDSPWDSRDVSKPCLGSPLGRWLRGGEGW